ncbi:MAG TPA: hypothetical protein VGG14_15630 [Candidatus Sulfotelmatobacter sp.]|jgi:hypothetical protein
MVLGMSLSTFTTLHVVISLIGIGSGLFVVWGLLNNKRFDGATAIFLVTTVLTSITGYLFPVERLMPSHIVGAISLVALAVAIYARYGRHMERSWRSTYVISAMISLYLNVFVLVVQLFLKVPALHALAPNGKEPPFAITQVIVMVIFIALAIGAVKKFHPGTIAALEPALKNGKAS